MMKNNVMSETTAKGLVVLSAVILLMVGFGLYKLFEYQGINKDTTSKKLVNYDIKDYVETEPVILTKYNNVFGSINVSRVKLKNLSNDVINDFYNKEDELIDYIDSYYNEIIATSSYNNSNSVSSIIKMQINSNILSIYFELDFNLDSNIFDNNIKKYFVTTNVDLTTGNIVTNDNFLEKYNYTKKYIAEKIYEEDLLITSGQIVIDKNTNISLTKEDIERKKNDYVNRIISEFDNIIKVYIENKTLVLVYNKRDLRGIFFDNDFDSEIITRYLK